MFCVLFKIRMRGMYGIACLGKIVILKIQLLKVNQNIAGISKKSLFIKEEGIINGFSGEEAVNG